MFMMFLADIGTATNQWDDKNYNDGPDICQGNVITDNYIDTQVKSLFFSFFCWLRYEKQKLACLLPVGVRVCVQSWLLTLFFSFVFDCYSLQKQLQLRT